MRRVWQHLNPISALSNALEMRRMVRVLERSVALESIPRSDQLLSALRYPFPHDSQTAKPDINKLLIRVSGKVEGLRFPDDEAILRDRRFPENVRAQFIYQMPFFKPDATLLYCLQDGSVSNFVREEMALHVARTPLTQEIVNYVNSQSEDRYSDGIKSFLLSRLTSETKASCMRLENPTMRMTAFFGSAAMSRNHPLTYILRKQFAETIGQDVTYAGALDAIIRPIYLNVVAKLIADGKIRRFSIDEVRQSRASLRRAQYESMGPDIARKIVSAGVDLDADDLSLYIRLGHTINWPHIADMFVRVSGFAAQDGLLEYFSGFRILPIYQGRFPQYGITQMPGVQMKELNIRGSIFDALVAHSPVDFFSHSRTASTFPVIGSFGMSLSETDVRFPLKLDLEHEYDRYLIHQEAKSNCSKEELDTMLGELIEAQLLALVELNAKITQHLSPGT